MKCTNPKCEKELTGRKRKYCSPRCQRSFWWRNEYATNSKFRKKINKTSAKWRKENRQRTNEIGRKSRTGFSPEEFNKKVKKQKKMCALCGYPLLLPGMKGYFGTAWNAAIADHNHDSKQHRGIIHSGCNRGLGCFKEDPKILRAAAKYMEQWNENQPYVAVDFDGTLAVSRTKVWDGPLGKPIPQMVSRVKKCLENGIQVRIFTARVSPLNKDGSSQSKEGLEKLRNRIGVWCEKYIGKRLDIVNEKTHNVIEIWDDRARQVIRDTGQIVGGSKYE
jgi:Recombination endonuclease VII